MNSRLNKIFEKLIDDYDEEQKNQELHSSEQLEVNLNKYIDERYFKFVIPSISNTGQQER